MVMAAFCQQSKDALPAQYIKPPVSSGGGWTDFSTYTHYFFFFQLIFLNAGLRPLSRISPERLGITGYVMTSLICT